MVSQLTNPEIRLLDGRFYADDPWPHFRWLREKAPVYWDPTARLWSIALHEDIMEVSRQAGLFKATAHASGAYAPGFPPMITRSPRRRRTPRRLIRDHLTARCLEDLEPRVRQLCAGLIESLLPSGQCDFVEDLAALVPVLVLGELLGIEPADRIRLGRWCDDLLATSHFPAKCGTAEAALRAAAEFAVYHRAIVADRRKRPGGRDLLSVLIHAETDGERPDDDALLHTLLSLLTGGIGTIRDAISGGMEMLLRNPEQRRRLVDDPSKIATAVEEMLRWVSPVAHGSRMATADNEFRGERIRAGDRVLLLYPSGNRDERVFADPETFDVERDTNPHIAFGAPGEHLCVGRKLARLELRVVFEEILGRVPNLELATEGALPRIPSHFAPGIASMPVVFGPSG